VRKKCEKLNQPEIRKGEEGVGRRKEEIVEKNARKLKGKIISLINRGGFYP